jgi:molybdate transport system ATP-binding protein
VLLVIHPRAVSLHRTRPGGSPRNAFAGTVEDLDDRGDRVRVRVAGTVPIVAEVTPAAVAELALVPGAPVWVTIKATEIAWHPA